jgi:hypothetical protein
MLGLQGFRSAAITLAGIELAHRIRKRQYSLPMGMNGRTTSLKMRQRTRTQEPGWNGPRAAGTGTTSTDTAASERPFRLGPILMSRLPWRQAG